MRYVIIGFLTSVGIGLSTLYAIDTIVQPNLHDGFLKDSIFYFTAPFAVVILGLYYRTYKGFALGLTVGFLTYYSVFWVAHLWGWGEALNCTSYFFDLLSNC